MRDDRIDLSDIELLDAYWDDRPLGYGSPLTESMAATVEAVHAAVRLPRPRGSFVRDLEQHLMEGTLPAVGAPDSLPAQQVDSAASGPALRERHGRAYSRRGFLARAAAVLAGAGIAGGGLLKLRSSSPPATINAPAVTEVWVSTADGSELVELDPVTLNPTEAGSPIDATPATPASIYGSGVQYLASADGRTIVRVSAAQPTGSGNAVGYAFDVFDGPNGPLRASFDRELADPTLMETPRLSPDGRLLLVRSEGSNEGVRSGPPTWHVYGTQHGRLLSTLVSDTGMVWAPPVFDPRGRYLYRLNFGISEVTGDTPETPVQVVVHDPPQGTEVARVDLPRVTAPPAGSLPERLLQPQGIVPAHDGAALFVPLTDREGRLEAIQTIDVERAVFRATLLLKPVSAPAAATPTLPQVSGGAEPTREAGHNALAALTTDGKTLVVAVPITLTAVTDGVWTMLGRWTEVTTVDLASGSILRQHQAADAPWVADIVKGIEVHLEPSADGATMLLVGSNPSLDPAAGGWLLQRRDVETFEILAERAFPEYRSVLIW